jgi:signal peptidase II
MLNDAPRWLRYGLFMTAAAVAVVVLLWMLVRGSGGPLFAASVPFIASGALGNLVDRVQHVYVVDFIRFHIHDVFEWPTFNVADSTITVGVILLLIDGFFFGEPGRKQDTPSGQDAASGQGKASGQDAASGQGKASGQDTASGQGKASGQDTASGRG